MDQRSGGTGPGRRRSSFGTNPPSAPLTVERIATLPTSEQRPWRDYLARSNAQLARDKAFTDQGIGCLGVWGFQEAAIDEIGMSVIVPPEQLVGFIDANDDRQARCKTTDDGRLRYWIVGDWRRGRQHPVAPTIDNWHQEMKELAALLHHPPRVVLEQAEDAR